MRPVMPSDWFKGGGKGFLLPHTVSNVQHGKRGALARYTLCFSALSSLKISLLQFGRP